MFAVTIAFGNTSWRLLYKTAEKAEEHFNFVSAPPDKTQDFNATTRVNLIDDFGQRAMFVLPAVVAAMLENLDESKLGMIELGLHNQRAQVGLQARAEQDPTCRPGGNRGGPGIITPMGMPNGRLS